MKTLNIKEDTHLITLNNEEIDEILNALAYYHQNYLSQLF